MSLRFQATANTKKNKTRRMTNEESRSLPAIAFYLADDSCAEKWKKLRRFAREFPGCDQPKLQRDILHR